MIRIRDFGSEGVKGGTIRFCQAHQPWGARTDGWIDGTPEVRLAPGNNL